MFLHGILIVNTAKLSDIIFFPLDYNTQKDGWILCWSFHAHEHFGTCLLLCCVVHMFYFGSWTFCADF